MSRLRKVVIPGLRLNNRVSCFNPTLKGGYLTMRKKYFIISLSLALAINVSLLIPNLSPSAYSAEVIGLKVAQYFPPPSFQSKVLEEFCRDLEKLTNGAVKVDYYSGGSLLKASAMFDGVVSGIADIGYSHVYYTAGRMPVTEAAGLPLGYPSAWAGSQALNDF